MNRYFLGILFFISLSSQSQAQTKPEERINSYGNFMNSRGKTFNPDVSVNFLGLLQRSTAVTTDRVASPYGISSPEDRTQAPHNGFSLQEAEVQFTADVDPYVKAVALLSVAQESGSTAFGVEPEEVYAETIGLSSVSLRAGKFKMAFGKHNVLHSHAFPFIDAPLIHQQLLGGEGLNDAGVSAAILVPASWYSEIILQALALSNETLYASGSAGNVGAVARFKNLFDLNDDLTLEVGLSGTGGQNQYQKNASVLGADLTFKWRPSVGGKYQALIWATEYLKGNRPGVADSATGESLEQLGGGATWLQYQFAQRWWVQARYEFVGAPKSTAVYQQNKQSALLGFFPSEFSGFRLQYDHLTTQGRDKADHAIALQYNISIGAHPAHLY